MRDVTDVLLRYLDAKQHIWNSYFWGKVRDLKECEPLDSFEVIDQRLFFSLVCYPLKVKFPANYIFGREPLYRLVVKPKCYLTEIDLRVSRPSSDGN